MYRRNDENTNSQKLLHHNSADIRTRAALCHSHFIPSITPYLHFVAPVTVAVRQAAGVRFEFGADFDTNGVLYHLATRSGGYVNPDVSGVVVAAMSSVFKDDPDFGSPERFVQNQPDGKHNYTKNEPNSWMSVNLRRSLVVDHYCLRSAKSHSAWVRNWELQGSDNGSNWHTLKKHTDDRKLADTAFSTANWSVEAAGRAFSHFRILQTGQNSYGGNTNHHSLCCAGIEFYGTLF